MLKRREFIARTSAALAFTGGSIKGALTNSSYAQESQISAATMENSFPQTDISVDQLTEYLAYALRILKNCDLPCEGITTPGGFGNKVKQKLPQAVFEAVRDVYATELPHYFKNVSMCEESVLPEFENVRGADTDEPTVTVNVPAGTGDWFGGWDGVAES